MRKVHQSYHCLSYFRTPPAVEISLPQNIISPTDSDVVPPTPRATRQNLAVLNRAFYEPNPNPNPNTAESSPTDCDNLDVELSHLSLF